MARNITHRHLQSGVSGLGEIDKIIIVAPGLITVDTFASNIQTRNLRGVPGQQAAQGRQGDVHLREFFATAFAALLRAVGVPSRVVGGFMGGRWDASAEVVVFTPADAHAWVEWYLPGIGWILDDATPETSFVPRLLEAVRPEVVVPFHWDDFTVPLREGRDPPRVLFVDVEGFVDEVSRCAPGVRVRRVGVWEEVKC